MPLVDKSQVERIELTTPGEWIEVQKKLSRGQRIDFEKQIAASSTFDQTGAKHIDPALALEAAEYAMLNMVIKAWSFDVPCTPENIRDLDDDDMDTIKAALNALYKERTPEQAKNS